MVAQQVQLRNFSDTELILDEEETRAVLVFFFPSDGQQITQAQITNELRNFAQGLLIEAVDASYAMGYIETLFKWVAHPGNDMKKALAKLVRRGLKYWFKNLGNKPLMEAKIYEPIRQQLSRSFRSPLQIMLVAKADGGGRRIRVAMVNYGFPAKA